MTDKDTTRPDLWKFDRSAELTAGEIVAAILPRGHAINGWSSASGMRMIQITPSKDEVSDSAPLLGFGVDGDAEMALGRALATYVQRERDCLEVMSEGSYREISRGVHPPSGHSSKFDNIVWNGEVTIYQEGEDVVIISSYGGGGGMEPLEVRAGTLHDAIGLLTQRYKFMSSFSKINESLNLLPSVVWTPKGASVQEPSRLD